MRDVLTVLSELTLIDRLRAALGAGVGLLLAEWLAGNQRKIAVPQPIPIRVASCSRQIAEGHLSKPRRSQQCE